MMWLLLLCGERFVFDMQWQEETKKVHATLVLNVEAHNAVMVCRKGMTGDLFKLWSLEKGAVMYFPKDHKAFTFESHQKVALIEGGPEFTVREWVQQFQDSKAISHDQFELESRPNGFLLKTKEGFVLELNRKSQKEMKLANRIFEPVLPSGTEIIAWKDL